MNRPQTEDARSILPAYHGVTAKLQHFRQEFIALNGGQVYQFSPAISLFVNCETQEEIDEFWEKLSEGGETLECGWLKDKYGISWQIVPTFVGEMLKAKDTDKTHRMLKALWQMQKLDVKRPKAAFEGRE